MRIKSSADCEADGVLTEIEIVVAVLNKTNEVSLIM